MLRRGGVNRAIRATSHNEASSRSHAILQMHVEIETTTQAAKEETNSARQTSSDDAAVSVIRRAKLNLVDLAGSEKYIRKKPVVDDVSATAQLSASYLGGAPTEIMEEAQLKEMTNINSSLTALGLVIAALSSKTRALEAANALCAEDPARGAAAIEAVRARHIPYRNAALTRLLQDSLGGNTRTVLIATISPCILNFEETRSTLKFADRAHSVMTSVQVNEVVSDATLLRKARAEIQSLKRKLQTVSGQGSLYNLDGSVHDVRDIRSRDSSGTARSTVRTLRKKNKLLSTKLIEAEERLQEAEGKLKGAVQIMADQQSEIRQLRDQLGMSPPVSPKFSPTLASSALRRSATSSRTGRRQRSSHGTRKRDTRRTSGKTQSTSHIVPSSKSHSGRPPVATSPRNHAKGSKSSTGVSKKPKKAIGKSTFQNEQDRAQRARERIAELEAKRKEAQRLKILHRKTKIGGGGGGGGYQYNRSTARKHSHSPRATASNGPRSSPKKSSSGASPSQLGRWLKRQNFFTFTANGHRASGSDTGRALLDLERDLRKLGVASVSDLADLEMSDLNGTQLKQLQKRRLLRAAKGSAGALGSPTKLRSTSQSTKKEQSSPSRKKLTLPSLDKRHSPKRSTNVDFSTRAVPSSPGSSTFASNTNSFNYSKLPSPSQATAVSGSSATPVLSDALSGNDARRQRHLKLLMSQTGASQAAAAEAYDASGGDIAAAIMRLFDAQTKSMLQPSAPRPSYQPSFLSSSTSSLSNSRPQLSPLTSGHSNTRGYGVTGSYGQPTGQYQQHFHGQQSSYGPYGAQPRSIQSQMRPVHHSQEVPLAQVVPTNMGSPYGAY